MKVNPAPRRQDRVHGNAIEQPRSRPHAKKRANRDLPIGLSIGKARRPGASYGNFHWVVSWCEDGRPRQKRLGMAGGHPERSLVIALALRAQKTGVYATAMEISAALSELDRLIEARRTSLAST